MNNFPKERIYSGKTKKSKFVNKYGRDPAPRAKDYQIEWFDLEHEIAEKLWEIHLHDSLASQCREYLLSYLGTKIEFNQNEKTISPSPEFDRILKAEWSPFIRDLFDTIFILGIVPITFQKSSMSDKDYIPVVLKRGTYRIQVAFIIEIESIIFRVLRPSNLFFNAQQNTTESGKKHMSGGLKSMSFTFVNRVNAFGGHSAMRGSGYSQLTKGVKSSMYKNDIPHSWILDRNSIVLHGFGYDPSRFGIINSRLKTIIEYSEFTAIQGRIMLLNQLRLLSRPIFIQNNEPPDPSRDKPDVSFTSTKHKKEEYQRRKKAEEIEALRELAAQYAGNTDSLIMQDPTNAAHHLMDQVQEDSLSKLLIGDTVSPISIGPLPKNYVLPSGQKPDVTLGMRFFDCDTELQPKKTAAYGIPVNLILNQGVVKAQTAWQIEIVQQTIKRWMDIINEVLTHGYNSIYGNEDRRGLLAEYLERYTHDKNIIDKIEKFIIDDWKTNEGEMTKFKNMNLHASKGSQQASSSREDEQENDSQKSATKKRSRSESPDRPKLKDDEQNFDKKLKTNQFDPMIQLKTHMEEKAAKEQSILKNIDFLKPVEVKLALTDGLMLDTLSYIYAQGGLLDTEYFLALRNRIGYQTDDRILKKLQKQRDKLQGLDQPKPAAGGSKKSKSSTKSKSATKAKSKPTKKTNSPTEGDKHKAGPDHNGGLAKEDTRGREADFEKQKKKKLAGDMQKSKESNMKREMSAHKSQASNAKTGVKNDKK